MEHPRSNGPRRRAVIAILVVSAGAAAVLAHTPTADGKAATKLKKSDVHYVERSPDEGKDCDDCLHYVAGKSPDDPGSCRIVEGPISPHGHCAAFTLARR